MMNYCPPVQVADALAWLVRNSISADAAKTNKEFPTNPEMRRPIDIAKNGVPFATYLIYGSQALPSIDYCLNRGMKLQDIVKHYIDEDQIVVKRGAAGGLSPSLSSGQAGVRLDR